MKSYSKEKKNTKKRASIDNFNFSSISSIACQKNFLWGLLHHYMQFLTVVDFREWFWSHLADRTHLFAKIRSFPEG